MTSSYTKINYTLRPAKSVERKMLCDLFKRLESFDRIYNYRYIGFGSIYFSDFQLFHQSLGICDMVSIEKDIQYKQRFEHNRLYRCIDLQFGHSNKILPLLNWEKRSIVWLDYENKLDKSVLADVSTICTHVKSCSFLLLTINININLEKTGKNPKEEANIRLETFIDAIGRDKVPLDVTSSQLRGKEYAKVCRRIIIDEIKTCLADRNDEAAKSLQ